MLSQVANIALFWLLALWHRRGIKEWDALADLNKREAATLCRYITAVKEKWIDLGVGSNSLLAHSSWVTPYMCPALPSRMNPAPTADRDFLSQPATFS